MNNPCRPEERSDEGPLFELRCDGKGVPRPRQARARDDRRWIRAAAAVGFLIGAVVFAQEAPAPTPSAAPPKTEHKKGSAKPSSPKPPLDFSGVWELDPKASQGVVKAMEHAAIKIEQNGNRIWISPLGAASTEKLLADQIVVDGQLYEKKLGKDKGTVLAKWGTDNQSLWIEAVNGTPQDPRAAVQRMVWRLRDFGNTWTRQSWTISGETSKQTFLVFRKRPADWVPTPSYFPPTPTAAPSGGPSPP